MRSRCAAIGLLLVLAAPAGAADYVVRPDGSGDFPTIQAAIDAAQAYDVINLADGVYRGEGNRDLLFGDRFVTLRSWSLSPAGCVIDCQGSETEPHRAFSMEAGSGIMASIEDLTITGGHEFTGGACYFSNQVSAQIIDVIFDGNSATNGAVIATTNEAMPRFYSCTFTGNTAVMGGGVAYADGASCPIFSGCLFRGNTAGHSGGALRFVGSAQTVTSGCTLSGNSAGVYGGAIACTSDGGLTILGCTLSGNSAPTGGGVSCFASSNPYLQSVLITLSPQGGALECGESGSAALVCCDLYGNAGGDWIGAIADQLGASSNISLDPQYCFPDPDAVSVWAVEYDSPCLPDSSGCAFTIGAWGGGCEDTPATPATWGAVKAMYR
jgi:predicted outer membrane repeat protein